MACATVAQKYLNSAPFDASDPKHPSPLPHHPSIFPDPLDGSRHRTVKREPKVRGNSPHSNDLEAVTVQGGCRQVIYISKGTNLFLSINIKR